MKPVGKGRVVLRVALLVGILFIALIAAVGFSNVQTNGSRVPYWCLFLNQNAGQDGYTNIPMFLKNSSGISVGKEYYLPFADNTTHGDYLYSRLYLFSPTNTAVRIDSDNDNIFETVLNVTENTETVYNYPIAGSHIVSDDPVLIYYRHQSDDWGAYDDQAFTYTLLPVSVLGVDYYLPSSPTIISMVATQSDTSIQIDTNNDGTPEASYSGLGPGDVRNYTNPPAGTHVTSNNPVYVVAVNHDWGGEDSTYIYSVLPTERLGTDYWFNIDYKTLRYNQVSNSSAIHIVATQDNTQLYINSAGYSLNAGETVSYSFDNGSVHITSDKPVGAAYIFNVYATDPWDGDRHYAHAMSLTPTSQLGTEYHRAYYVVATHDNTRVDIDGDHDGVFENTTYLNAGEAINTFYVKSHPTNPDLITNETGHIRANYPVLSYFVLVGDYQGTDECTWMYTMLPSVGVGFDYPMYVAINGSGYVYATDTHNHRVLVFDAEGNLVNSWGSFGAGDEQFAWPHGIAVNATGYVYVADTYHHKIKVFDANGNYVNSWGSQGSGAGEFFYPHGIGINGSGYVYVADWMNERICVFDANGNFIRSWGGLYQPRDVKVNASGYVYVADTYNHIMKIYDANGNYIKSFGSFYNPFGVAINGSGYVYVSDTSNHIIKVYDANGNFVDSWGTKGSGEGQFRYPRGVAVNDSGYVYVVDWGNDRIQVFDADGNYVNSWGAKSCEYSQFFHPVGVAVNGSGYVYVTDEVRERVCIFDRDGRFIRGWGLSKPWGIDVNSSGYVYVANTENHSIQIYDADGNFVESWGSQGSGAGQFQSPYGIAINGSGYVYVADSGNQRIQVFDPSGNYITSWGSYGSGNGQFIWPRGIAVNGSGYVYVADTSNHRVQVFDPSGNFVESWGGFFYPWDVSVNATGYVYVADTGNHRVRVFDAEGNLVAGWGSLGTEFDQLYTPRGIAVNGSGYVYVDDGANHRLCVFDPSGGFLTSWRDTFNVSIVDNTPPQVTITTPADDYTVNTGTIYIIGEYDGTGSSITSILCNDSRFTLQSSVPIGSVSGTYTFSNNTFIPNGSFYIEITVQDSARLKSTAIRRILVGQSISWDNKIITGTETYSNVEIILNGNLTIASGGSLTLTNVTLRINCTSNGSNHIEVQGGGALYINDTDGDPSTRGDATNITALNPNHRFTFLVRSGATFQMNNSELHHCGYTGDYPYTGAGLWINTNNTHVENNTLTNNHHGIILYYAHHNTIKNNTATNNSYGFYLYDSSNNTLENNTAANNGDDGFYLSGSSNNTFSGNTAANNGGNGFYLFYSSNNTFSGNTAANNGDDGFYLAGSSNNNTLENNTATNNGGSGFGLPYSSNNTFSGNTAANNGDDGFGLHGSSNNTFSGNTAANNGDVGFDLYYSSNNNTLENNTAANNNFGFWLAGSSNNNTLENNTAANNGWDGFLLYGSSSSNILHGNVVVNSTTGYSWSSDCINNDFTGSTWLNYLRVNVTDLSGLPIPGADVMVETDGTPIYATPHFGGANDTTDTNGLTPWINVPYKTFTTNDTMTENTTTVTVYYFGFAILNNPRTVHMSTSHTELFQVDNADPTVTITTPAGDSTVNTGVVWINGTYNGTGSSVTTISCNDSRFTLQTSPPFGETGAYSFVNNTPIPTGDFWTEITVTDQSGLTGTAQRRVIVDQDNPTLTITVPAGDSTVNTGVVWINGSYDGTGSAVQSVAVNDSRFTIVVGPPFGETGFYSFRNNTAVPTSEFGVRVTVTDGAGLAGEAERHVIVDQTAPSVSITVPAGDSTVNTGVVWINGTYDGKGSNVAVISCNDSRFTLQTSPPFGETGAYSFVNNTPIPTGDFWTEITVIDQTGLTGTAQRRVIVDQDSPAVTITAPAGDSTVNTGVVWINGSYDGTGSAVQSVAVNDSRFTLRVGPPFGVVGVFAFSNNTPVPTGSFCVRVSVRDGANLVDSVVRLVVVDQSLPSVSVTTPFSDATVNAGYVIIEGRYNGTGSGVQRITCNDSRFTLQTGAPFGASGTYVFVNNTPIPTGSLWVTVTVADEAGLESSAKRRIVVDQEGVTGSGFWDVAAGSNRYVNASPVGVELFLNVTAPVRVYITNTTTNIGGPPPSGLTILGGFLSILVNDTGAVQGVGIIIHYSDEGIAGAGVAEPSLGIGYWDEASGGWITLESTVDTENNVVRAHADHLTLFACMGPTRAPSAPPTSFTLALLLLLSQPTGPSPLLYAAVSIPILALVIAAALVARGGGRGRPRVRRGEAEAPRLRAPKGEPIEAPAGERAGEGGEEAWVRCPFCGNKVSSREKTCPRCGGVLL